MVWIVGFPYGVEGIAGGRRGEGGVVTWVPEWGEADGVGKVCAKWGEWGKEGVDVGQLEISYVRD